MLEKLLALQVPFLNGLLSLSVLITFFLTGFLNTIHPPWLIRDREVKICNKTEELKTAIEDFDQQDRFLLGQSCEKGVTSIDK